MESWKSYTLRGERTLKPLSNFHSGDQAAADLPAQVRVSLVPNEELIGIYVNSDFDLHANLVFTTRGIYVFAESWMCIEYTEVADIRIFRDEHVDAQKVDTLILEMEDGQSLKLLISGAVTKTVSGFIRRFPDLYSVHKYITIVVDRLKREQQAVVPVPQAKPVMELNESIRSHAYRRLHPLKNFQTSDQAAANLPDEVRSAFASDEELLGIYINSDTDPHANLVFTTRGIHHFAENWMCLEYAQIFHMRVYGLKDEGFDKSRADTFWFQLKDGQEVKLKVSGAVVRILSGYERRFPDFWEVDRFFIRVLGRIRLDQLSE